MAIYEEHLSTRYAAIAVICSLSCQGKYDECFDCYKRALTIYEKTYPTDHSEVARYLQWIGFICFTKSDFMCASEYYEKCLHVREVSLSMEHSSIT